MARRAGVRFFAILDLKKAYGKVVRRILREKLYQILQEHLVE